ncbi:MAG: protein kinase, partial [Sandaracinaceae bacterium]|nr:protein kinase [Sandaracinaceae bacterium]
MGVVFEAIDAERGARVALKTLRSVRPRAAQRFKNEFRALSDLSHPNVVELHELHVEDDRLYFTMELVEGTDFLSWVSAPGVPTGWSDDDLEGRAAPDYDR